MVRGPVRTSFIVVGGAGAVAAVCVAVGETLGYAGFAAAWTVHFLLMAWTSAVIDALGPALSGSWFRVRAWEPGLYRRLGAWSFMRLLRRIGWERAMRASRSFDGTRATLAAFDRDTRRSELAHTLLGAAGVLLAVVAAIAGAWTAVAWHTVLTILLHA